MSKEDIKNIPADNDKIPKGACNTIGKQALQYTKSGVKKDKHE